MKLESLGLLLFFLIFTSSCGNKDDVDSKVEESAELVAPNTTESEKKEADTPPSGALVLSKDIMKPLAGTDACFEAVELVRDEGDIATYKDLGDSVLLKKEYVERHGHKTYLGTIGRMIKEKKTIPEIRQTLLNKCRGFMKARESYKSKTSK